MSPRVPYRPLPLDQLEVRYAHGPDSVVQQGVPAGETIEFDWRDSNAYPGTSRKANLIHHGDIPVTIGMFVDPGVFEGAEDPKNRKRRVRRVRCSLCRLSLGRDHP